MVGRNPWRDLRAREHVKLESQQLHPSAGNGRWDLLPDGSVVITLRSTLGRRARNDALSHELVHDERRIALPAASPLTMELEEARVRTEATVRQLPLVELAAWIADRCEVEPITVGLVAEEFDVAPWVAERALRRLLVA